MVSVIFIIGVLNLTLGFALAVAIDHLNRPAAATPVSEGQAPPPEEMPPLDVAAVADDVTQEQIPARWLELLEREGLVANSFVEATAVILKLEIGRYRAALVEVEDRARRWNDDHNVETLAEICEEYVRINREWDDEQSEVAKMLSDRNGTLGVYEEVGSSIHNVLDHLQDGVRTSIRRIDELKLDNPESNYRCLVGQLADVIDLAHLLRDEINESLITIMQNEERIDEIEGDLKYDALSGLVSRQGIEVIFAEWWRDDATRTRMVSAALIDIDEFSKLNRDSGTRFGDQVIAAFGDLLSELNSVSGGTDRVCRFAGQRFMLFFGDSGPRQALATVERVRQSLQESVFEHGDRQWSINVSGAVTEVKENERTCDVFDRLKAGVKVAQQSGRNATCIDEGSGPRVVKAPQFQVHGRVIKLASQPSFAS